MAEKSYIIALEEHYFDPEVKRHITGLDATNVAADRPAPRRPRRVTAQRDGRGPAIDLQVLVALPTRGCRSWMRRLAVGLARRGQ